MTEEDWETCTDHVEMFTFLRPQLAPELARRLAYHFTRTSPGWPGVEEYLRGEISVEEADRLMGGDELRGRQPGWERESAERTGEYVWYAYRSSTIRDDPIGAYLAAVARHEEWAERYGRHDHPCYDSGCDLIRELVGNPFRPPTVSDGWLTTDVRALVRGIGADGAFERMPILADALQDAGCENPDILDHCRRHDQQHHRECWVLTILRRASGGEP